MLVFRLVQPPVTQTRSFDLECSPRSLSAKAFGDQERPIFGGAFFLPYFTPVTVNLDIKYISAGKLGDNLVGKVEVLKRTKTLVFINCKILNSKGIVATASGTWKILS